MKNFTKLLLAAHNGDKSSIDKIINYYMILLQKESIVDGRFDDDVYQELSKKMYQIILSDEIEIFLKN